MAKTVLITGGNRGLGLCLASQYLELEDCVVVIARKRSPELDALDAQYPGKLHCYQADVTDEAALARVRQQMEADGIDTIDILINNAGVWLDFARYDFEDPAWDVRDVDRQLLINAAGPVKVLHAMIGLMKTGEKQVVGISSDTASVGGIDRKCEFGYCMSKAALNMSLRVFENRYAAGGFRVYAIHPGWMRTDMGGPQASDDPADAAADIVALLAGPKPSQTFTDRKGNPMAY